MDKDGAIDIIVFFCSFGVISTGNNLTPASEVVVTGRRRETTQVQENKVEFRLSNMMCWKILHQSC
ncbi:hypothetical protein ACUOFC_09185, partial [Escherichia sp. TWPC-MK]